MQSASPSERSANDPTIQYRDKFGGLPPKHVITDAVISGEWEDLEKICLQAIEDGNPIRDWEPYRKRWHDGVTLTF